MKPALPSARQQQVLRLGVCALLAAAAVSGTAYRLVAMNRCAMDHDLLELLLYGTEQLQAANVPYWLEFGTLLGAVRDKAVVPWEFDVDLAVTEQHCERVLTLREKFAREKGYKMYGRGEYVPEKAALFGMVGGTISAPCVRVYSRDGTLPLDIYWSKVLTLTPDHTTPEGRRYIPPPDRSGDLISAAQSASADSADSATAEQILCDHEAFTTDIGDHTSPCRWYNDIFPLTTTAMYGRQFPVPRRSRKILTQTYGPNWMTPKPKGYKALLCPPVWHTGSGAVYGVAAAGALALAAALFVYLRASYASALALSTAAPGSAAATAAAAAAKEKDAKAAAASGSDAALADAPGCCDRAFARVFRWTGVGAGAAASPALIGADADGDASDADADADPADPDHKRLHSV